MIWNAPGGEKVRDIALRPGLNIVWSPDGADDAASADQTDAIGHGSGKTLFCRLIRYCLGEDRFATEPQRDRIGTAFINGIVGAEVMLDGTCWAIVRPLGIRRRHMAVADGNLDEIAAGEGTSTGLEPFIDAVDQSVITTELAKLVRPRTEGPVWPIALAWLTRDQECRFDDVLDWRSPTSDSDSPIPASGQEKGPRLEALRAFLMAITPEEQATRGEVNTLSEGRRILDQEIGHRRWEIERTQSRLIAALDLATQSLPEMPLLIDVMRKSAEGRLSAASKLPAGGAELVAARSQHEAARVDYARLEGERIRIEASIPIEQRVLSEIQGELPGLSYSQAEAESPICPICEVPIDRALADGCKLSHKIPDAEACRQRWAQRQAEFEEQGKRLEGLRQEGVKLLPQIALAKQQLDQAANRVAAIEKARDTREATWYAARRVQDDVERVAELIGAQDNAIRRQRDLGTKLEAERERLGAFRDKQARIFGRMSEKFDPIIRRLIGRHDVRGRVTLSGKGLELSVDLGGDRSTAAIESLKILAFDLSALCLSIEGVTRVPAFLLHDSPREADLGLSIYGRLFDIVEELERVGGTPLFQYIVTTTTAPPAEYRESPYLRFKVHGDPPVRRLLGIDL
ncbi:chromosome segregation protein SMC [Sphingomonas sp. DBB INV C78]|uniref:chromosome segregation protein SMC n=1 Tax=Sphingomonas sp. DBB INV C78 TaxID=3349434 RepID=UPI0036D3B8CD